MGWCLQQPLCSTRSSSSCCSSRGEGLCRQAGAGVWRLGRQWRCCCQCSCSARFRCTHPYCCSSWRQRYSTRGGAAAQGGRVSKAGGSACSIRRSRGNQELAAMLPLYLSRHPGADSHLESQLCALHIPSGADHHSSFLLQRNHHPGHALCGHWTRHDLVVPVSAGVGAGRAALLVAVLQVRVQQRADGRRHILVPAHVHPDHAAHGVVCVDGAGPAQPGQLLSRRVPHAGHVQGQHRQGHRVWHHVHNQHRAVGHCWPGLLGGAGPGSDQLQEGGWTTQGLRDTHGRRADERGLIAAASNCIGGSSLSGQGA